MAVAFRGPPIPIEFQPVLRAHRGKLLCGEAAGTAVLAASFLHQRRIVLDRALLRNPRERDRILAHEIFHFVWWKLAPSTRSQYEAIIQTELAAALPGEMGWSAQWRKEALPPANRARRTPRWREYLCESFCDTAAAHLLSLRAHDEITLPAAARRLRARWMRSFLAAAHAAGGLKI